jgi:hypothetical protein
MLGTLRLWLSAWRSRNAPDTSRLIVGSTGSGKSEGELVDLVRLAGRRDCAVVLLDGHGPLAFRAAGHWAARGHESRIVYESLDATDQVLCWTMLPRSASPDSSRRLIEDAETRDEVAQCFMAQRNLETLNDKPWTKEWLEAAISLCLSQPRPEPLDSLPAAFRVGSAEYERLLGDSDRDDLVAKFRDMERLRRKNEVQYEIQTGASRRLLEVVCNSEVARLRSRPGPFDWLTALRERKLVVFDGGGIRSRDIKRTLFLLVSMQVIHAVRRQFAATQEALPVVLVLEEAGALGLVTPFVLSALQELRKAGLAIHLITQSSLDFGDRSLFEAVLANTPWQAWYQLLSPADQELGAKALANATFDPLAVHFTRVRQLHDGTRTVTEGGGQGRSRTAYLARYREVIDAYYKTPGVHEQEFETRLATLRIGERLVRDRGGVRGERVSPVRSPWFRRVTEVSTRAIIERIRRQPIYLPCPAHEPVMPSTEMPDAAERLRTQATSPAPPMPGGDPTPLDLPSAHLP